MKHQRQLARQSGSLLFRESPQHADDALDRRQRRRGKIGGASRRMGSCLDCLVYRAHARQSAALFDRNIPHQFFHNRVGPEGPAPGAE